MVSLSTRGAFVRPNGRAGTFILAVLTDTDGDALPDVWKTAYPASACSRLGDHAFLHRCHIAPTVSQQSNRVRARPSFQPVLETQTGHLGEVRGVAAQERRVVGEGDAGDFQVQRPDTHALTPEIDEPFGRLSVPR